MAPPPSHLEPSKLGTKEYWDTAYTLEHANYLSNPKDEGTEWFSDSRAAEKVVAYLQSVARRNGLPSEASFVDIGMGNGHLVFALREEGDFEGRMVGVDYSEQSVVLARRIAQERGLGASTEAAADGNAVRFERWDVVHDSPDANWVGDGFDVVLDKGTFDAISLSDELDENGLRGSETYATRVAALAKRGGLLVLTSCNWTEKELRAWFEGSEDHGSSWWKWQDRIEYPRFTFGGQEGQAVCTVVFQRREDRQ
ncbi:MAG: hypothetical protein M1817_004785 [Caeruleum heppii]|nr:MAG: hypothetical protein M1817_004785 [Caeruleum heppii]